MGCLELSRVVYERMKAQLIGEHKLSDIARTDYLTGLANRSSFDELDAIRFGEALSGNDDLVVALIDLDGFKNVNDNYGHCSRRRASSYTLGPLESGARSRASRRAPGR